MEVKAERTDMFMCVVQNKCHAMGQYYAEDDWKITSYAPTIEALKVRVALDITSQTINVSSMDVIEIDALIFEEHIFMLQEKKYFGMNQDHQFWEDVLATPEYIRGMELRKEREAAEQLRQTELDRKRHEAEERAQLERLSQKYGKPKF